MSNPNQKQLDFFKAAHDKYKKDDHPAHKHLKKVISTIEKGGSPTEVLKNVVHAHCFDCSHDSADAAGSHPKKCTETSCPFYAHRPGAKKETKESSPDVKAKRQEVAANARSKRKISVKECMEALEKE
jgi:hypothetical protein